MTHVNNKEPNTGRMQTESNSVVNVADIMDAIQDALNSSIVVKSCIDTGVATGGSNTTIVDTAKDFPASALINKFAEIALGAVTYTRKITANSSNTITIDALPGAAASAVIGAVEAGQVTVVSDSKGVGGNEFSIEFATSSGNDMALSSSLTGLVITVYLGTGVAGALDDAKNTATLIAASISEIPNFTATMTGSGGAMGETAEPVEFSGGVAVISVSASCIYRIKTI